MAAIKKHMNQNAWLLDSFKGYCGTSYAVAAEVGRRIDEPFKSEVEYSAIIS